MAEPELTVTDLAAHLLDDGPAGHGFPDLGEPGRLDLERAHATDHDQSAAGHTHPDPPAPGDATWERLVRQHGRAGAAEVYTGIWLGERRDV
jgi:hypothetical protein